MMFNTAKTLALALVLSGASVAASAQTWVLNDGGSAFPNPGNYGTVELVQDGANVDFTVTLADGFNFVTTGNQNSHSSFTFNATGVSFADVVSIADATPVAGEYGVWAPAGNSPFGTFSFGIHCLLCANGGPGQQLDPLTFTVLNATVADFMFTSVGGTAALFAADIIGNGVTGAVGVTQVTPVPEPSTYALMLAGLGALGFVARRRRQQI